MMIWTIIYMKTMASVCVVIFVRKHVNVVYVLKNKLLRFYHNHAEKSVLIYFLTVTIIFLM